MNSNLHTNTTIDLLLVEDIPEDADLVIRALKKGVPDMELQWVEDGAEALDYLFMQGKFKDGSGVKIPKLILLDLNMPKISGTEVLRRIRADKKTRRIPVVVLTSSREIRDIETCYDLGVNSYIVKPVDFVEFTKTITDLGLYWLRLNLPSE